MRRKTHEEFLLEIKERYGEDYVILEEYKGNHIPIEVLHQKCQKISKIKPHNLLQHPYCHHCNGGTQKTFEEFMKKFDILEDKDNYEILTEAPDFHGVTHKIKVKCLKCGNEWDVKASNFLWGTRCPKCAIKTGKENSAWKGGITNITPILRGRMLPWQIASNNFYSHKCLITNTSTSTVVHHAFKNFSDILNETLILFGYDSNMCFKDFSDSELEELTQALLKTHYKYGLGVPMNDKLHREFHAKYGTSNNTLEQYIEFAKNKGVIIEAVEEQGQKYLKRTEKE